MAVDWEELNRSGLFEVCDVAFYFFKAFEVQIQNMHPIICNINQAKQLFVQSITSEEDVQILWSLLLLDLTHDNSWKQIANTTQQQP